MPQIVALFRKYRSWVLVFCLVVSLHLRCYADASSASLSVAITDTSGAVVPDANIVLRNTDTNQEQQLKSSRSGSATFSFIKPGHYGLTISKNSFADISVSNIVLNVGDEKHLLLALKVGSAEQIVNVDGSGLTINTTDASVSTIIDRKFVENTPLNGRSFQSLILLTPGSTTNTPQRSSNQGVSGEFSINGQRTESNYYSVDGVSANTGASSIVGGAGITGSLPPSTALGTTQSLASVDALQEFRVESSTYSAEYGRTPGGQFALVTRSGNNDWHGTVFDYFRNDALDANSWFNDNTSPATPKSAERQNDFGGTFGGYVLLPHLYDGKNKTFFFVSYEGLRLVQPQDVSINYVPSLALRQSAPPALTAILDAFPLPTSGAPDPGNGLSEYIGAWSSPSRIDSTSIRIDQNLGSHSRLFFRFSDTPSQSISRGTSAVTASGVGISSPSVLTKSLYGSQTYTGGLTTTLGTRSTNEFRLNRTNNSTQSISALDAFGGAVPLSLAQIQGINPNSTYNIQFSLDLGNYGPGLDEGSSYGTQSQWNVVDTFNVLFGKHSLKFGFDWRQLSPVSNPNTALAYYAYFDQASVLANTTDLGYGATQSPAYPVYKNFSLFAQDEWRVAPRLSLSMGVRWDVNPAPGVSKGLMPYTVTGLNDLSTLQLAPQGTPLWKTTWYNIAPRLGVAYTVHSSAGHETVLRGGGGVFFDTGQQTGSSAFSGPGFSAYNYFGNLYGTTTGFPVPPSVVTPPVVNPPVGSFGPVYANPPHFQAPYTYQWNASLEQALGRSQSFTLSYVGANGRKLLRTDAISAASYNPAFSELYVSTNGLTSSYNSLQLKYQRQVAHGLQTLASYTWSHALDYGSYNLAFPYQHANSDQDVRNNFAAAISYELPTVGHSMAENALLHNWSLDGRFTARGGFPVTLNGNPTVDPNTGELYYGGLNLLSATPLYVYGSQFPGRRSVNPSAFSLPSPGQTGNAPRNLVRGFDAVQMDVAVRREFPIFDSLRGQFRAEAFNVFNHPSFGTIDPFFGDPQFGQATASLAQSLGVLSPIYQTGASRSIQLELRLNF